MPKNVPPMGGIPDLDDPTNKDTIPAWLTKGEFVLNKEATQMFGPLVHAMNQAGLQTRKKGNALHLNEGGGAWWDPRNWAPGVVSGAGNVANDPTLIPRINETLQNIPGLLGSNDVPSNQVASLNLPSGDVDTIDEDLPVGEDSWVPPSNKKVIPTVPDVDVLTGDDPSGGDIPGSIISSIDGNRYHIVDQGGGQLDKLRDDDGYLAPLPIINAYRRSLNEPKIIEESKIATDNYDKIQKEAQIELANSGTISNDTKDKLEDAKGKAIVADGNVSKDKTDQKAEKIRADQYAVDSYEEYKTNASLAGLDDIDSFEQFKEKQKVPEVPEVTAEGIPVPTPRPEAVTIQAEADKKVEMANAKLKELQSTIDANKAAVSEKGTAEEQNKVLGFMEELGLGEYFEPKQLANIAVQYLGSRILGYDHNQSMGYAVKQYGASVKSAMNAETTSKAALIKRRDDLNKSGKFTPASVDSYLTGTGNLVAIGDPKSNVLSVGDYYNIPSLGGRVQSIKKGGKEYAMDPTTGQPQIGADGTPVEIATLPGVEKWDSGIHSQQSREDTYYKYLENDQKRVNRNVRGGDREYTGATVNAKLSDLATEAVNLENRLYQEYGVSAQNRGLVKRQVNGAMSDFMDAYETAVKTGGTVPTSLEAFYNKRVFNLKTGLNNDDVKNTDSDNLEFVNQQVQNFSTSTEDYKNDWQQAKKAWNQAKSKGKVGSWETAAKELSEDGDDWDAFTLWMSKFYGNDPEALQLLTHTNIKSFL